MKKIKLFFVRNYQRFIRFLISFSAVFALIIGQAFSAGAVSYYDCVYAQPQLTGNNCYLEVVFSSGWKWLIVVQLEPYSDAATVSDVGFLASVDSDYNHLVISPSVSIPSSMGLYGFRVDMSSGVATALTHIELGNPSDGVYAWIGKAGTVTGIHGYNCSVTTITTTTDNSFSIRYGSDASFNNLLSSISSSASAGVGKLSDISSTLANLFNQNKAFFGSTNMDQILKAIQDNKSSAEKNQYSGATTEQKKAQSDLDTSEKKISDDTAEARASTINIFKNFTLPGDIMKGLLCVTNIFNSLCAGVPFAPIVLNFSLAIGAAAFLLGLTAVFVRFGRSRK